MFRKTSFQVSGGAARVTACVCERASATPEITFFVPATGRELVSLQVDTMKARPAQTKTSFGLAVPVCLSLCLCTIIFDARKL